MSLESFIKRIKDCVKPPYVLRFAPNPNDYLTLGHLKGIFLLDKIRKDLKGRLDLRFDDTDPSELYQKKYYLNVINTLKTYSIEISNCYYSSKNHDKYVAAILNLFQKQKAFYCACEKKELHQDRKCLCMQSIPQDQFFSNLKSGKLSPLDNGTVRYYNPSYPQGNFVIYRKKEGLWFPTIALQGPVDDYAQKVNLILRGRDLQSLTQRQKLIYEDLYDQPYPLCQYWGRIELYNSRTGKVWKLSKSLKSRAFPSLKSFSDKGYTLAAIKQFLLSYGLTKNDIKCDLKKLSVYQCHSLRNHKLPCFNKPLKKIDLLSKPSFYFIYQKPNQKKEYCFWNSKTKKVICYTKVGEKSIV